MATYVTLLNFTEQGVSKIKDTCKRAANFAATAKKMGVDVKDIFWTLGAHDGVIVFDAADDAAATAAMLGLSSLGNVTSETLRAFRAPEMEQILKKASR